MPVLDRSVRAFLATGWMVRTCACDESAALGEPLVESAEVDGPDAAEPLPFAGWLDVEVSPVVPWCGVTLIAPDIAVTAAGCFNENVYGRVTTSFGGVEREAHEVREVVALQGHTSLVALVLDPPVVDIEPAKSTEATEGCAFESISYLHGSRDAEGGRWSWSGCLTEGSRLTPEHGEPNCHGDLGAGVFDPEGKLVGITIATDPGPVCAAALLLAPTAAIFDEAMDASHSAS